MVYFVCLFFFQHRSPTKSGLKTRSFCDICDVFDSHETEDCPLQSNDQNGDTSSGSKKNGQIGKERPYCDICEGVFLIRKILQK